MRLLYLGVVVLGVFLVSCRDEDRRPVGKQGWLSGSQRKKLDTLALHLRGNDVVMWEVRRRHAELYRAILANNRKYGLYQLKKIALAMKMGAGRRPKRKTSYEWFFVHAVPPMESALQGKGELLPAFQAFTALCVTCHAKEKVSYIPVPQPWK